MKRKKSSPRAKPKTSTSRQADALRRALAREKTARTRDAAARTHAEAQLSSALETKSRDQQAATSEILRIISQSSSNAQLALDVIADSALRLCGSLDGAIFRYDGTLVHLAARSTIGADNAIGVEAMRRVFPRPLEEVLWADALRTGLPFYVPMRREELLHGGRIWVKIAVGRGSTFTFTLPLRGG